jgi:hypothetical protein
MAGLTNLKLLTDFFNKIGPLLQFAAAQQFCRFRSEAGIQQAVVTEPDLMSTRHK